MNDETRNKIGELVGEASMCWSAVPLGVFDSQRAVGVIDRLTALIQPDTQREQTASTILAALIRNHGTINNLLNAEEMAKAARHAVEWTDALRAELAKAKD